MKTRKELERRFKYLRAWYQDLKKRIERHPDDESLRETKYDFEKEIGKVRFEMGILARKEDAKNRKDRRC